MAPRLNPMLTILFMQGISRDIMIAYLKCRAYYILYKFTHNSVTNLVSKFSYVSVISLTGACVPFTYSEIQWKRLTKIFTRNVIKNSSRSNIRHIVQ